MKNLCVNFFRLLRANVKIVSTVAVIFLISTCTLWYKMRVDDIYFPNPQAFIIIGIYLILTAVVIGVLYWAKRKKWKIEKIYLVCGLILGFSYIFAFPIGLPQDENAHFYRVYELSEFRVFPDADGNMQYHSNMLDVINSGYQAHNGYASEISNIDIQPNSDYIDYVGLLDSNSPFSYLPHILAVWVGKILHLPLIPMLFLCRIFGLITCVTIIYFCIKYIPFMKKIVFLVGLLPMSMQVFSGVTGDGLTICAGIALVTYVLYSRTNMKRKFKWWDYLLLLLICLTLSVTKVVYAPMCLMLLWIPKERFTSQKRKIGTIVIFGIIALALIAMRLFLTTPPGYYFENPEARIQYILQQPLDFICRIFYSIGLDTSKAAESMMGRWFGIINLDLATPYPFVALLLFILLCTEREKSIPRSLQIFAIISFAIGVLGVYTSMFVICSDLSMDFIMGVHGRYFLPMILLIPLAFLSSPKIKKRQLIQTKYLYIFCTLINVYAIAMLVSAFI